MIPLPIAPESPQSLAVAAIALGSNLPSAAGGPEATLAEAVRRLCALGTVVAQSRVHRTAPVGYTAQPDFCNAACLLATALAPLPLLAALLEVERSLGRVRTGIPPKGPRTLDLDLLLYTAADGTVAIINEPGLTLPHPELHRRAFVLEPLAEIAPDWVHPLLGRTVAALRDSLCASAAANLPR